MSDVHKPVPLQARLRSAKSTVQGLESRGPAPSLHYADCISDKLRGKLAASLDFTEDLTATYRAKMRVYGQVRRFKIIYWEATY